MKSSSIIRSLTRVSNWEKGNTMERRPTRSDVALRAVSALKATVQTVVAHAITVAKTGHLMDDGRNLRRQLIGMRLERRLGIVSPKLVLGQNRGQLRALGGGRLVVSRNVSRWLFIMLRRHRHGNEENKYQREDSF